MPALTLVEVVAAARAAGFTHAETYGGPVPLATWRPYGEYGGSWRGEFVGRSQVRDVPRESAPGFGLGIWQLLRIEGAQS